MRELTTSQAKLYLLLEGLVSVSIQFLVLRQITPFIGSGSVMVTSIVISVFLAALACGYHTGGIPVANPRQKLAYNLYIASVLLGIGISFFVTAFVFQLIPNKVLALVCYLFLFMAPIVFLVAQTVPLLVNYFQERKKQGCVSQMAGDALTASTIGNVIGGLITTLLIMYYLGVGWAIVMNALALLFIASALDMETPLGKKVVTIIALFTMFLFININVEKRVFVTTNSYANYRVIENVDDQNGRLFSNNASNASYINKNKETHAYISYVQDLLFHVHKLRGKEILVLGSGGFTISAKSTYNNHITYVDIDGQIKEIAEQFFLKEPINGDFVAEDARSFLIRHKDKYDVIFLDAFNSPVESPTHLTSGEFFELIRSRLNDGGYFIVNAIGSIDLSDRHTKNMDTTIRSVFNSCQSQPVIYDTDGSIRDMEFINVIYSCYLNDREFNGEVYIDGTTRESIHHFLDKKH